MSLQKKYYYNFKGLTNVNYLVEIWQNTTNILTPEEVKGDNVPFKLEYPQTDIFTPVKGSGVELNLVSTTDRKFISLYTADILEYQIRLYKAGVLVWCGYLDSELYNEVFTDIKNYTVTFTGSDGFALLDRFTYVDNAGLNYTGISTQWQVIQNILNKLNLPYKNIYVGLSTVCNDFTLGAGENIFSKTYTNSKNWYNEDLEPETVRKVLEEILKPYSAFIVQNNANIYITDVNTIAGATSALFLKYDGNYSYVGTESIDLNLGDLTSIKFAASDSQFNVCSGYNKQVINYSAYTENSILSYPEELFTGASTDTNFGILNNTYTKKSYETSTYWNKLNSYGKFYEIIGTNDNSGDTPEKFLAITPVPTVSQGNNEIFTYKANIPDIVFSTNKQFYLKLEAKIYVRTLEEKSSLTSTTKSLQAKLKTNLTIGNKRFRWDSDFNSSVGWYPIEQPQHHTVLSFTNLIETANSYSMANIADTWVTNSTGYISVIDNGGNSYSTQIRKPDPLYIPIPLAGTVAGNNITFSIGDYKVYDAGANRTEITSTIQDIKLKDIKISIVDSNFNPIDETDLEYIGYMNKNYKNEADKIVNYQGSSVLNSPIEKGSLLGYNSNYYYLSSWSREGKTDIVENLLLRSLVSNYTNKRTQLTGTINLLNSALGCVKYQNFLPNQNLMLTGIVQNFADNTSSITIQEVVKDNLDINKSW